MRQARRRRRYRRQAGRLDGGCIGSRPVYFADAGGFAATRRSIKRDTSQPAIVIAGPALIEEYASTTVAASGRTLTVDAFGNLQTSRLRERAVQ